MLYVVMWNSSWILRFTAINVYVIETSAFNANPMLSECLCNTHNHNIALRSSVDDSSDHSENEPKNESPGFDIPPLLQMGASIGAENVGRMLFDEEILKSGRGDVRVGTTGRWRDFKGNEIVRNEKQDPE